MPKEINQTFSEGLDGDAWQQFLANLRGHLRNDGDWKSLAEEANMAYATIRNIAYGKTRSPHAFTVYRLMFALGREQEFLQAVASDNPMSADEAKRHRRNWRKRVDRKNKRAAERKAEKSSSKVPASNVINMKSRKKA